MPATDERPGPGDASAPRARRSRRGRRGRRGGAGSPSPGPAHRTRIALARDPGLQRALCCLAHPASLAAIGVLLLNDHVLKGLFPGPVTGKLSDLAGLFFFPFLLAAGLAGAARLAVRPIPPAVLGPLAGAITAGWFAAIKLTEGGRLATEALAGAARGGAVRIAPDPTDLVALVSVLGAAWLWRRAATGRARPGPGAPRFAAVAVAAAATIATSDAHETTLTRFLVHGDRLYVIGDTLEVGYTEDGLSWPTIRATSPEGQADVASLLCRGEPWVPSRDRRDLLLRWTYEDAWCAESDGLDDRLTGPIDDQVYVGWGRPQDFPPTGRWRELTFPRERAREVAAPADPRHRFRIRSEALIEESLDGGRTWTVGWQIPPGRREFLELGGGFGQPGPFDLAWLPDGSGTLVAAMGREGVLVRRPDGEWLRVAAGGSFPEPLSDHLRAAAVRAVFLPQLAHWLLVLVVVFGAAGALACLRVLRMPLPAGESPANRDPRGALRAWAQGVVLYVAVAAIPAWIVGLGNRDLGVGWGTLAALVVLALPVLPWRLVQRLWERRQFDHPVPGVRWRFFRAGVGASLAAALAAHLGMVLWLTGAVAHLHHAQLLVAAAALACLAWLERRLRVVATGAP